MADKKIMCECGWSRMVSRTVRRGCGAVITGTGAQMRDLLEDHTDECDLADTSR